MQKLQEDLLKYPWLRCTRCHGDTLELVGDPILTPFQVFEPQSFPAGAVRMTPLGQEVRYPVRCVGKVLTRVSRSDWGATFTGHRTEILLEHQVKRTGNIRDIEKSRWNHQ